MPNAMVDWISSASWLALRSVAMRCGLRLISSSVSPARDVAHRQVGTNTATSARDIEAHADDGHLVVVRRNTADRHCETNVSIRHERNDFSAARDVLNLEDRALLVLSEDTHTLSHLS